MEPTASRLRNADTNRAEFERLWSARSINRHSRNTSTIVSGCTASHLPVQPLNRRLLRHRLAKLGSLGPGELRRLVRAQLALLRALVVVRTRPTGHLVERTAAGSASVEPTAGQVREARALALAVARAAEHGLFRGTCLIRSVALQHLLQRRGIAGGRIRIGVRMDGGKFLAHAWVEWNGEVLGDRASHVGTFSQLRDVEIARGR